MDGFVSVDWGTLTTRPLRLEADRLFVNAVGPVTVEALDEEANVLGAADIAGDSIRHEVAFGGRTLGELVRAHPVRLRFTVPPEGTLYSFMVR